MSNAPTKDLRVEHPVFGHGVVVHAGNVISRVRYDAGDTRATWNATLRAVVDKSNKEEN